MSLALLSVNNLRNLVDVKLNPAPKFNILYGANGSGKTSVLEAIYLLSLGRSFRTRLNTRLIRHQATHFSLFAQIHHEQQILPLGIERFLTGESRARLDQEELRSHVVVTKLLPMQLLNPDSRLLLTAGSKLRRQFIDWGVFHVEPQFLSHWQHAQRILKQRNAALKRHAHKAMIQAWDAELEGAAQALNVFRRDYINQLTAIFTPIAQNLLGDACDISLKYKAGWDETSQLRQVLAESLARDLQLGYTQHGPQRADLLVRTARNIPAQDILSQGQQKLLVYALHLAQGMLLKDLSNKRCIYLLDDLPAELDAQSRQRVAQVLYTINAQVFVSGVDLPALADLQSMSDSKVFHVEQGNVREEREVWREPLV